MNSAPLSLAMLPLLGAGTVASSPDLGKAAGQCRPHEDGPALLVSAAGLKDRQGRLKLEVYPARDDDFLADDNVLVAAGKTFRRVEVDVPASGTPLVCVRVPGPGQYSVMLLHDHNSNRKFGWRVDGIGFGGNPALGWSKPKAASTAVLAGRGPTPITIVLNYRQGLGMRPLVQRK